ncbi:MAG: peptide/nickel transport system substrate-binding protein [Thermomicrobiales bacterium]|jgi:peptide/nickel transport system substrate-binding protein|nr:peptide/nickel transport system substrate-binding protein [Thermomicrobiales bacterium]
MKRLLLVLVLLAMAAVPAVTRAHAQSSGVLRAGLDVDAGTGDPRLTNDTSGFRLMDLVFDGLVVLDSTLVPQPALATSWDNPDPTTWVFHLRQGVKFHDGTDLTADDVVYTFETILDENFAAPFRALYAPITSVTATDPQTVQFKLKEPYAPFLSYMDMAIVPKHVAEDASKDFANNPVGTGAFKFVSWERNSKIELTANADYWNGAPKLSGVQLFIIPDNTVRATALETGDLDLIHSPLSPQDVAHLKEVDGVTVSEQTALGYTYLNFNTKDPILSDVNVRRALAHLVDKNTISQDIYESMDIPGKSPLVPGTWWYADVADQAYDPAAAAKLLTDAGWAKNADGVYEKDGQKLTIVLKTHSEDPNRIQILEFLQNVFKENGVDASVETTEWPTYIAAVQQHDYQIALIGWLRLIDPDYAMYAQFRCDGGLNWGGYCDPKLDDLLAQGRANADQTQRAELYQQVATTVVDQVYYDVLLYQGYIVATRDNVTGFVPNPSGSWKSLTVTSLS